MHDFLLVVEIPTNRVQKLLVAGGSSYIATRSSLNTINRLIEAGLDVHNELVRLLLPSSLEVKSEERQA